LGVSADALKYSIATLHAFPITFFIPVILVGATAGAIWPDDPTSTIPLVAMKVAQQSHFGAVMALVVLVSCVVSFMSTADSVVISTSVLFTQDFFHSIVMDGKASMRTLMITTKSVSFLMISISLALALYWAKGTTDFLELLNLGGGILNCLVPAYLGIFFPALQAPEVLAGMMVNLIVVLAFSLIRRY